MPIVLNLLFHCFRHCSVHKIRPEFLKTWFLIGGALLYRVYNIIIIIIII